MAGKSMTSCTKASKAFQKLLTYEPIKPPCRVCDKVRPYPTAPAFGTTIKVCSIDEMERICFPNLCDCPDKETIDCSDGKLKRRICEAIKMIAAFSLAAFLWDVGILRHPIYTTELTEKMYSLIQENFATKGQYEPDSNRIYEIARKQLNMANVWNTGVVGLGDLLIAIMGVPKIVADSIIKKAFKDDETTEKKDEQ